MQLPPKKLPGTPAAEIEITPPLVAALLAEQHADLTSLRVQLADEGWDNAMFRLGDSLAVRLPRRAVAEELIRREQAWLPRLGPRLTLPIPVPIRLGTPARNYPWHWSVVPWLPGQNARDHQLNASQATPWGTFLRSLHTPAPADAPVSTVRGVPLPQRSASMEQAMQRVAQGSDLITKTIRNIWQAGVSTPPDAAPTWLHGDLHPLNVLVQDARLSAVIDWGDITSGDPATDLASIWMLLAEPQARQDALAAYGGVSEPAVQRAKAWAVLFGVMFLDSGLVNHPANAKLGATILKRIVAEH